MSKAQVRVGSVCRCRKGIFGVVAKIRNVSKKVSCEYHEADGDGYWLYEGIAFDGTAWQSKEPVLVAETIEDYLEMFVKAVR